MSIKKTLNAKNLEALGAQRLAELLIEISTGSAAAKRRLRLELAGAAGVQDIAREVRKRLTSIGRSTSYVDWTKRKALIEDLETQRRAIIEKIAPEDPREALDLAWQFMGLADSVEERCHDSSGAVGAVFRSACIDLSDLAIAAKPEPIGLAERVFAALMNNGYGQFDSLLPRIRPALGSEGLARLKALAQPVVDAPQPVTTEPRRVIGYGSAGPLYEDEIRYNAGRSTARRILQDVADAEGDVDAFIALFDAGARRAPSIAAGIAMRLIEAGRATEAVQILEAVELPRHGLMPLEWEDARITALDALGRESDAQTARWTVFESHLSAEHLREFLRRLPDFDDLEAEEKALDRVEAHRVPMAALQFLIEWPALDRAARMIITRPAVLDGDFYQFLTPAAEALAGKHPLAATLVLRSMIEFALQQGRATRYRHAARDLEECAGLATVIGEDFRSAETHTAFVARLQKEHGRKASFWILLQT